MMRLIIEENEFYRKIGLLIMYCQQIEHDVKIIYAGRLKGEFDNNYKAIKNKTLGQVVSLLISLDKSNSPDFTKEQYALLKEITSIRNYWVHNAFSEYRYKRDDDCVAAYNSVAKRLIQEEKDFGELSSGLEKRRLGLMKKYGRI